MINDRVRILVADNQTLFREGVCNILRVEQDFEVVGEAEDGVRTVTLANRTHPDILLLDSEIPEPDVMTVLSQTKRFSPSTRVLVLSTHDRPSLMRRIIETGASGYLLRSVSKYELVAAIRKAQRGGEHVVVSVSRRNLVRTSLLSRRETEVLELVAKAMTNRQISGRLDITEGTVKRHLHNIFRKLDASSRIEAVNRAVAAGIITEPWKM